MAVAALVSYVRLTWWTMYVLMRYRTAPPGQKARRIYKFKNAREVRLASYPHDFCNIFTRTFMLNVRIGSNLALQPDHPTNESCGSSY